MLGAAHWPSQLSFLWIHLPLQFQMSSMSAKSMSSVDEKQLMAIN
jgi:hypothetical protein